jgi:hypothetical protein
MFTTIKNYLIGSTIKTVIFTLAMVFIITGFSIPDSPASTLKKPALKENNSEENHNVLIAPAETFFKNDSANESNSMYDGFRMDDIVDLIYNQHNQLVDKKRINTLVKIVIEEAPKYGNPPIHIILAIINRESTWDPKAKSGSSYGAMQVHYTVWGDYCNLESAKSLYNPRIGIRCGLKVFSHYFEENNGNINKTLQRYRGSDSRTNARYARDVLRTANKIKNLSSS